MFVLVRHATAKSKRSWRRSDTKRPLNQGGVEEAAGLAQTLAGASIDRLVSSPALRCRQTLAPLASATGLPIRESELLARDADPAALDRWITAAPRDGTVCCTHGETLTALLKRWDRRGRLAAKPPATLPKGAALVVTESKKGLILHELRPVRIVDAKRLRRRLKLVERVERVSAR